MFSLLRIARFAVQDILRNFSLSFMTVLILILMLLSVNTLFIVEVLTNEATSAVKNQIDVSVYFDHKATEEQVLEIREYVSSFPEVVEVTYLSREEVLEQFREKHKNNVDILSSLEELESNPLGPSMIVKMRDPSEYRKVITALDIPEYENVIEAKTFADTERAIDRIGVITTQVERFSIILSAFFAAIAFLIIFNTVRVAIYTQRVEINIKKLVGATNWFIRGPYVVSSLIFSIVSVLAAYAIILGATQFLDPYISIVFDTDPFLTNYFKSHILMLGGIQFVAVFLLTVVSSMVAMRKHLRT
jgi:cell division transport system permease protein